MEMLGTCRSEVLRLLVVVVVVVAEVLVAQYGAVVLLGSRPSVLAVEPAVLTLLKSIWTCGRASAAADEGCPWTVVSQSLVGYKVIKAGHKLSRESINKDCNSVGRAQQDSTLFDNNSSASHSWHRCCCCC